MLHANARSRTFPPAAASGTLAGEFMSFPIHPAEPTPPAGPAIVADRLYTPDEAALLLGITSARRTKTLGTISRPELPVVWVGPNRGVRRYLGRDLLAYIHRRRECA
jgi:hypothetical protein